MISVSGGASEARSSGALLRAGCRYCCRDDLTGLLVASRQSAKLCEGKNCDYSVSGPAETGHRAAASKVSAGYLWVAALGAAAQGRGGGLVRPGGVDGCLDNP